MIKRRKVAIFISMISLCVIGSFFSNCAKDLPSDLEMDKSSQGIQLTPVVADIVPAQIPVSGSAQIVVEGGQPPYSYSVLGGTPTISSAGAVTGPFVAGSAMVITVTDSAQQWTQISLAVMAPPPPTPLVACKTPWGTTVASGDSVVAFNYSAILCGSLNTCQSQIRVCTNGVLSGTFTSKSCTKYLCYEHSGGANH